MHKLPATFRELYQNLTEYRNVTIEFKDKISELETEFDPRMRTKILNIRIEHNDLIVLTLCDTEWSTYNDTFAARDYFDKQNVPCLTAKEAGYYKPTTSLYVMATDSPEDLFSIFCTATTYDTDILADTSAALCAALPALILLGNYIGNEHKGGDASGIAPFDRCAIVEQVKDTIARLEAMGVKA